jgi:hypothetical protein
VYPSRLTRVSQMDVTPIHYCVNNFVELGPHFRVTGKVKFSIEIPRLHFWKAIEELHQYVALVEVNHQSLELSAVFL